MPKKYISFLGTGIYKECKYLHGDYKSKSVRFIQEANLDKLFNHDKTFGPDDKVVIILTDESEKKNWVGESGLETCIENLNLPVEVELKRNTPVGKNEDEITEIFKILYDSVDEGDELYLDITHAFRYMPMVLVVLANYAKLLKNATVASITYGNYEGRVKDIAKVIEFKQLSVIQDWTLAAGQFINCGSADMLVQVADSELTPILKESRGADNNANSLRNGMRALNTLASDFSLCQGKEVVKASTLGKVRNCFKNGDH